MSEQSESEIERALRLVREDGRREGLEEAANLAKQHSRFECQPASAQSIAVSRLESKIRGAMK